MLSLGRLVSRLANVGKQQCGRAHKLSTSAIRTASVGSEEVAAIFEKRTNCVINEDPIGGVRGMIKVSEGARVKPLGIIPRVSMRESMLTGVSALSSLATTGIASQSLGYQPVRHFHAKGSKVRYMDFRYKFNTSHYKSHLLIIRKQKMKKHQRRKWRKKFKCLLAKKRLKREIAKEKTFRVELLTMIKRAEQFDPREYALRKISEANNVKRPPTREERLEEIKELIRKHRYQVDYIKPKHKRLEI